jgi:hypothetical protein
MHTQNHTERSKHSVIVTSRANSTEKASLEAGVSTAAQATPTAKAAHRITQAAPVKTYEDVLRATLFVCGVYAYRCLRVQLSRDDRPERLVRTW